MHLVGFIYSDDEKHLLERVKEGQRLADLDQAADALLDRQAASGIRNPCLITNCSGLRMSALMLRNRWGDTRASAVEAARERNTQLAARIKAFQFQDIRPKAASEIDDLNHASRLLGHSKETLTQHVCRRVGEVVNPTK